MTALHAAAVPQRLVTDQARAEFRLARNVQRWLRALAAVGAVTFITGLALAPERTWMNLLLAGYYVVGVGLAGIVFVALQYVTGASWGVAIRRVPEAMCALIPIGAAGVLLVIVAHPALYPWTMHAHAEAVPAFKRMWLSLPFFGARALLYTALWIAFAIAIVRGSRRQDVDASFAHTRRNIRLSALFLIVFGITYWLASYDWVMSLEPDWASTIFGIYNFAGLFVSGLAVLTLMLVFLQRRPALAGVATRHHLHDLGKLLFAFSTFWMYLWFSQYMLIWYANIPEETVYYVRRLHGFWQPLFLLDMVLNWVVPFLALMPRTNKQKPGVLAKVCIVLLVGRWLDLYLMIAPPAAAQPRIGLPEIGLMAGAVGVFGLAFLRELRKAPLVPVNDPHLAESLHYHA